MQRTSARGVGSNILVTRTVYKLRFQVLSALRTPAAGYLERLCLQELVALPMAKRRKIRDVASPQRRIDILHKILGIAAALLTIVTTIGIYIYTRESDLEARLRLRYEGYFLTITNNGNASSRDNYVRIVFWRQGAPAPDYEGYEQVRDLPSRVDYSMRLNFWEEALAHGHKESKNLHEFGYVVVSSSDMKRPKAWAFHVCYLVYSGPDDRCKSETDENGNVLLARFDYPEETPGVGVAVNIPEEYSKHGWYPPPNGDRRH